MTSTGADNDRGPAFADLVAQMNAEANKLLFSMTREATGRGSMLGALRYLSEQIGRLKQLVDDQVLSLEKAEQARIEK